MPPKINPDIIRLRDILRAIEDIEGFMIRSSLEDRMALMAVAYEIAIIGESSAKLSEEVRKHYSDIPWSNIIGMRHRIIHDYGKVNEARLQEVIKHHLPELKKQVISIIQQIEGNSHA